MHKKYIAYAAISLWFGLTAVADGQVTPNIGLNLPPYGTTNYNIPLNQNSTLLDLYLSGNLGVPGMRFATTGTQPACSATTRGNLFIVQGNGSTTSDSVQICILLANGTFTWNNFGGGATTGTVTSVGLVPLSWETVTGSPVTGSGTFTVTPTTGQVPHLVIGTCGTNTVFGPCALGTSDLPVLGNGSKLTTYAGITPVTNDCARFDGNANIADSGAPCNSFSALASGSNSNAALVINTGASLTFSGSGIIAASTVPSSGIVGLIPATSIPNPTSVTLGGVKSLTQVAHEWINAINTAGQPIASQPTFADIAGTAIPTQLPLPTYTTLGGVYANSPLLHQFITSISSSGNPLSVQPSCSDLSNAAMSCSIDTTNASNIFTGTLASNLLPVVPIGRGGNGSTSPGLVAGTNITISGTWPNQVITGAFTAATAFSALTSATNNFAAMVVGTGASLSTSGSGSITATTVPVAGVVGLSFSGSTTKAASATGILVAGDCAKFDASGNVIDSGGPCGSGGVGTVLSVAAPSGAWPSWFQPTVTNPNSTPSISITTSTIPATAGGTGVTFAQGSGPKVQLASGSTAVSDCVAYDASGNAVDGGGPCVYLNQSNTYTSGTQNFAGAAGLILPTGAGSSPTTSGSMAYDTTTNRYRVGLNGVDVILPNASTSLPAAGNCVTWGSNYTLADAGAPCGSGSGSSAFGSLTSGTNSIAAMVVGSGASLSTMGSGTIIATSVPAAGIVGTTGSGNAVLATSPNLVSPALGTPSSVNLINGTGLPLSTGVTGTLAVTNGGTGTAVAPSIGQFLVAAGASAYAPSTMSGDCSLASGGHITCVASNGVAFGAAATASVTGAGSAVLSISPTLVTPALGTPSSLTLTNATGLPGGQITGSQSIPPSTLPLATTSAFGVFKPDGISIVCSAGVCSSTGGVTFPASGYVVVANGTSSPAGLGPVNGDCIVGAGGVWTVGSCATAGVASLAAGSSGALSCTGTGTPATGAVTCDGVTAVLSYQANAETLTGNKKLQSVGELQGVGSAPAITNTTGTVATNSGSNNVAGTLTSSTSGTILFTMTWASSLAYAHRAICFFRDETTTADIVGATQSTVPTTTTLTVTGTTVSGDIISYFCSGN